MLSCSPTLLVTIKELQSPLFLERRRNEWYRNRRHRVEAETRGRYSNFANTLKEIVKENNEVKEKGKWGRKKN